MWKARRERSGRRAQEKEADSAWLQEQSEGVQTYSAELAEIRPWPDVVTMSR